MLILKKVREGWWAIDSGKTLSHPLHWCAYYVVKFGNRGKIWDRPAKLEPRPSRRERRDDQDRVAAKASAKQNTIGLFSRQCQHPIVEFSNCPPESSIHQNVFLDNPENEKTLAGAAGLSNRRLQRPKRKWERVAQRPQGMFWSRDRQGALGEKAL